MELTKKKNSKADVGITCTKNLKTQSVTKID